MKLPVGQLALLARYDLPIQTYQHVSAGGSVQRGYLERSNLKFTPIRGLPIAGRNGTCLYFTEEGTWVEIHITPAPHGWTSEVVHLSPSEVEKKYSEATLHKGLWHALDDIECPNKKIRALKKRLMDSLDYFDMQSVSYEGYY